MLPPKKEKYSVSRRTFLQGMSWTPLLFMPAPIAAWSSLSRPAGFLDDTPFLSGTDFRLVPHYPAKSPLDDVLRLVVPGTDEYVTEKYEYEIMPLLNAWSERLKVSAPALADAAKFLDSAIDATPLSGAQEISLRTGQGMQIVRRRFASQSTRGREGFLQQMANYLSSISRIETAEFEIVGIEEISSPRPVLQVDIRYDVVGILKDKGREERVGHWQTQWARDGSNAWRAIRWKAVEETVSRTYESVFIDVTSKALGQTESYKNQMLYGADYWRTVVDGACGIDVYGNNGLAVGDFDSDGLDDFYVCQPAGLPNRLYRNLGEGTFADVTEQAGVGVLDNTACALFADFENKGLQDLLVVCGSGPLLFLNQGNGTFQLKRDAFKFAKTPQGTFTHAAVADYDRDGLLDIYFCVYSYYQGLDQYRYPVPYFDARNGPPNFLMHNQGEASFEDRTEAAG